MIVVVGANGIAAWEVITRRGIGRRLVCLNDAFVFDFPNAAPRNPRAMLVAIRDHSEALNGRTLSIADLSDLT